MSAIEPPSNLAVRRTLGAAALAASALALLLALIALTWAWQLERGRDAETDSRNELEATLAQLSQRLAQVEAGLKNTEQRQQDALIINRNLRDEMLGVAERAQLLETAVQQLNQRDIDNVGELRLNNAAFLLGAGVTQLHVFHDSKTALMALRLADAELAAAHEPAVAGVRQTLGNEIAELAALPAEQDRTILDQLRRLLASVDRLPPRRGEVAALPSAKPGWLQRAAGVLGDFVRVEHRRPDSPGGLRPFATELARAELRLALLQAEAAWLRRDLEVFKQQLDYGAKLVQRHFASEDHGVQAASEDLASLRSAAALAPVGTVGSALEQLRNLLAAKRPTRRADPPE